MVGNIVYLCYYCCWSIFGFINHKYWPQWFEVATDTQQQGRTDNELDWKPKLKLYGKALKDVFLDTLDIVQDVFFFQFLHSIAKRVHGIYFISFLTYFDLTTIILAQLLIGFFVARKYREMFNSEMKLLGNFCLFLMAPLLPFCYPCKKALS